MKAIDILTRREIEARIVAPLFEAFAAELGRERALEILQRTIQQIAQQQGDELAHQAGGDTLTQFTAALEAWKQGDAMEMELLEQNDDRLSFNVTRCRYAEMYRQLGIPELGRILSCGRDYALMAGFNPTIHLTRTQTIMEGAPCCDFRYEHKK